MELIFAFVIAFAFMGFYIFISHRHRRKQERELHRWRQTYLNTDWKKEYEDDRTK